MAKYRQGLPQLKGGLFLTDGGLETTLIFHKGIELPHFAAFDLLRTLDGREMLRDYHRPYIAAAQAERLRLHFGRTHMAGQRRLGRQARLLEGSAGGGQPRCDLADGRIAR